MKKTVQKIPAKLNLTLCVMGKQGGYHTIKSLVASVGLYDKVTLTARKDDVITLRERGLKAGCYIVDNNAFKAAKLFMKTFHTGGVDIVIDKRIPVGGGLGGSSADAAAVLLGMNRLFQTGGALRPLADALGSDVGYMLTGGYAVMSGRGTDLSPLPATRSLPLLLITGTTAVSSRDCYAAYDLLRLPRVDTTPAAVQTLTGSEFSSEALAKAIKNDLFFAVKDRLPEIGSAKADLLAAGAFAAEMTGSGSTVFGLFSTEREQTRAYKALLPQYGDRLIKTKTLS